MNRNPIVLFVIAGAYSHYNTSFKLAKIIQKTCTVLYLGPGQFESVVTNNGFEFAKLDCRYLFFNFEEPGFNLSIAIEQFRLRKSFQNEINELFAKVETIKPDLILLDGFLARLYPLLRKNNVVVIQTMVSLFTSKCIPPINSILSPSNSKIGKIKIGILLLKYFLLKRLRYALIKICSLNKSFIQVLEDHPRYNKRLISQKDKMFHPFVYGVNEILLSPQEFDFPWQKRRKNQIYFGLSVDLNRLEKHTHSVDSILQNNIIKNRKIVYCSFGSITDQQSQIYYGFINKLKIIALNHMDKLFFIVSFNLLNDRVELAENFKVFPFLPQLHILKTASLMVNHGGLNSIQECIQLEVPMIVYPLNKIWDQRGNAIRVKYHQLGEIGNLAKDQLKDIEFKILSVLFNPIYKERIKSFKTSITDLSDTTVQEILKSLSNSSGK